MKTHGLYCDKPHSVVVHAFDLPPLAADQVRVRATLAAIKHGTLFHIFSGESPFHDRRFDLDKRLFVPRDPASPGEDMVGQYVGNMLAGVVEEVGPEVASLRAGDRVFCHGPACTHVNRPAKSVERLPDGLAEADALCLDPALFAFAAVRDARVGVGDHVVVFGLGAIGLYVVQLLHLAGCLSVFAVDPIAKRRELAEAFGATCTFDPAACDVAEAVRGRLGVGADCAIEASGHYAPLREAMRVVRQCGRVVTLGYYKGRDTQLELGAEWLHNRLEMICTLPDWSNPCREAPLWTRDRLWRTLIELFRGKRLTSDGVLDPIVPLAEAPETFLSIYADPSRSVKMGIRFDE